MYCVLQGASASRDPVTTFFPHSCFACKSPPPPPPPPLIPPFRLPPAWPIQSHHELAMCCSLTRPAVQCLQMVWGPRQWLYGCLREPNKLRLLSVGSTRWAHSRGSDTCQLSSAARARARKPGIRYLPAPISHTSLLLLHLEESDRLGIREAVYLTSMSGAMQ